jgi:hypothetical protein
MKVASRSGFFVFLGGILAARNVVHVRAAFTLEGPPINTIRTDIAPISVPLTAVLAPRQHIGDLLVPELHLGELLPPAPAPYGELMSLQVHFGGFMSFVPMGK